MVEKVLQCRKCGGRLIYLSPGISRGEAHYRCPKCGLIQVNRETIH